MLDELKGGKKIMKQKLKDEPEEDEFDEDEELSPEEEIDALQAEEDEKNNRRMPLTSQTQKRSTGGLKQVKQEEEEYLEETEEDIPKTIARSSQGITKLEGKRPEAPVQAKDKFEPYHIPEKTGIVDVTNNKIVGEDVLSILAVILNKLDRIEASLG